jgi:hypothetical protein
MALVLLSAVLLIALLLARRAAGIQDYDRYWIDYDAPGVDITSEGPDGRTRAWYEIEGDESHDMG